MDMPQVCNPEEKICALKNVLLKGHIFQEYALLNLELEYEHTAAADIQTSFLIALPYHAVIRRLTVTVDDEVLVRGRIVSQEELEQNLSQIEKKGKTLVMLRCVMQGIYKMTVAPLPPCTNIKISVECYAELEYRCPRSEQGAAARLVFPAAATGLYRSFIPETEEWDIVPYRFRAELELAEGEQIEKVVSPTHVIETDFQTHLTFVRADFSEMTRDFVLDIYHMQEEKNKVYVVREDSGMGGLAFYSLRAPLKQLPDRKVDSCRILLDASGNLLGTRLNRAKQTVLELLKQLPAGLPIQVAVFNNEIACFAEQEIAVSDEWIEKIRLWMDDITVKNGYTVGQAVTFFSDMGASDAGVLISSGAALGKIHVIRKAAEVLADKKVCFIITDGKAESSILPRLNELTDGGLVYSFPEDSAAEKVKEIRQRLFVPSLANVSIIPIGGVFDEIIPPMFPRLRLNERVNFVASFRGRVPGELSLSADGGSYRAQLAVEEIKEFEHFDLLSLAYGSFRLNRLYDLLLQSPASVWGDIREEIVKTAVEYQLFCDDSAMLCELPTERSASGVMLRANVPILKNRPFSEFAGDISILRSKGEKKTLILTAAQRRRLLFTVLYAQCADGSFADFDVFDSAGRLETTALCLAALCREEEYEKNICRAAAYLLKRMEDGGQSVPIAFFALVRAQVFLNSRGKRIERLQMFLEQNKAPAAAYAHADAEIPSCIVRGEVSSAARMLLVEKR